MIVTAACVDESRSTEPPTDPEGTVRISIDVTSQGIEAICYDVEVRDGLNALVLDEPRLCRQASEGLALTRELVCKAASGRANHSLTLRLAGVWLEDETPYDPTTTNAGDLALVTDPCPDGCTVQVNCTKDLEREASMSLSVLSSRQGVFDLQIKPTGPGRPRPNALGTAVLPFACYRVNVTDGLGDKVLDNRVLCAWAYGDGSAVNYLLPCNARSGAVEHLIEVEVSGLFLTVPDVPADTEPGAGDLAAYAVTCADDCAQTITCVDEIDTTVTFAPIIARR
jgi:hypothetical protein